ncbi:MAG: hypothetical protein LBD93_12070 [Treponema sp.]|jgi:hypothetical protein|nr:hypothetical protein [Treponema sp.]
MKIGSQRVGFGSLGEEIGSLKEEIGSLRSKTGSRRVENGTKRAKAGSQRPDISFSGNAPRELNSYRLGDLGYQHVMRNGG